MLTQIFAIILLAQTYANAGNCFSRKAKIKAAVQKLPIRKLRMLHATSSVDFKTVNISQDDQRFLRQCVQNRCEEEIVDDTEIKPLDPASYAINKLKQKRKVVIIPSQVVQAIIDHKNTK